MRGRRELFWCAERGWCYGLQWSLRRRRRVSRKTNDGPGCSNEHGHGQRSYAKGWGSKLFKVKARAGPQIISGDLALAKWNTRVGRFLRYENGTVLIADAMWTYIRWRFNFFIHNILEFAERLRRWTYKLVSLLCECSNPTMNKNFFCNDHLFRVPRRWTGSAQMK